MPYILILIVLLTACGGGGDIPPSPPPPPVISLPPVVIPLPVATFCSLNDTCDISAEVIARVNALRIAGQDCGGSHYPPTVPLVWNVLLQKAAYNHSLDMATKNYFNHTSPSGGTFMDRLSSVGYGYNISAAGENIAAGSYNVESTITMWKLSPGHCQNMMSPSFRSIGVGYATATSGSYGIYWTMDLTG